MTIELDHETLLAAAQDVRATREEASGDLKRLSNAVAELGGAWQGQAATRFQELMERWNGDTNKLLSAMGDIADLLDKSGTQHQSNEEEQASMFNSLSGLNE
jgi:WXG100 family type VII secretion target